jgi:hypothetical protein
MRSSVLNGTAHCLPPVRKLHLTAARRGCARLPCELLPRWPFTRPSRRSLDQLHGHVAGRVKQKLRRCSIVNLTDGSGVSAIRVYPLALHVKAARPVAPKGAPGPSRNDSSGGPTWEGSSTYHHACFGPLPRRRRARSPNMWVSPPTWSQSQNQLIYVLGS